jgi:hypothetical protein
MTPLLAILLTTQTASPVAVAPSSQADSDVAAIMSTVNALRAAVVAHDGAGVLAVIRPEGEATIVAERPDRSFVIRHPTWAEFVGGIRPGPERFDPRFHDVIVRVDGPIAVAWTPYAFSVDGTLHHCGANHFDLLRENGAWKILNITYTYRTRRCQAE